MLLNKAKSGANLKTEKRQSAIEKRSILRKRRNKKCDETELNN